MRLALAIAAGGLACTATAQPLGTAFTYQGQLTESGQPASGLYDLQVCLFDSPANPSTLACATDFNDVPVEDGVFTLALDFGAAPFAGQQRYLELRVRPGASTGGYTILSPRQLVRATPEALRAAAASAAPWSGLTGVPAGFADGVDDNSGGTVTSVAAGTGLTGGTITGSGTLGIANGGVGPAQIAPGAVGPTQLAAGAVGLSQINSAQVQARITGSCAVGEYFRGIGPDGTVACERVPGVPALTVVDDPPANNVSEPALAIGADGLPIISYWDSTDNDLKVARCVDAACTRPAQIRVVDATGSTGRYGDIAIGSGGLPVISYISSSALELRLARCLDAACTNADLLTLDTAVEQARTAIVVPPADPRPAIAYARGSQLHLLRCTNTNCSGPQTRVVVDPTVGTGGWLSMAVGSDGLPVIAYSDGAAGSLKLARCTNADCSTRSIVTVDDPVNSVGSNNSIAIGPGGLAVISYRDNTAGALKIARCGNIQCNAGNTINTISAAGSDVFNTRIAIGADGAPLVVFADSSFALRALRCGSANCSSGNTLGAIYVSANPMAVGSPALALGSDQLPLVAFTTLDNGTDRKLWFAKCGNRSCQ
jgi:hypothetical protein